MAGKARIQVEWINVTYRSVGTVLLVLLLVAGAAGGYWFYFQRLSPMEEARESIARAEERLGEAAVLKGPDPLEEVVASARAALAEAHREFVGNAFADAQVAASRSELLSMRAIGLAGGDEAKSRMVRLNGLEGDVRVKQAGEFAWKAASRNMVLRIGDQVKTSSSGSAQLIYFDGTVTTIRAGSLLEIRDLYEDPVTKVRRVRERLTWGEAIASTQKKNVRGSYHEVATDLISARSEDAGEFRIAFNKKKKTTVVDVFDGRIEVSNQSKKKTVTAGERLATTSDGSMLPKQDLPGVPRLTTPSDQRVFIFEKPEDESLTLAWERLSSVSRYRLVIADSPLFTRPLYDANRRESKAVLEGVDSGSYFWRVAGLSDSGVQGPFSGTRRFRISSQQIKDQSDREPPALDVSEFVPVGQMVIINGQTEPGAALWVNNDKVDVYEDGSFNTVVKLYAEGLNEILLVAQDTAGNETTVTKNAFVQVY